MLYGFSFLSSTIFSARNHGRRLHCRTWLRGTFPMISSISGQTDTFGNVPSVSHDRLVWKHHHRRHLGCADSVWAQMICAVYVAWELSESAVRVYILFSCFFTKLPFTGGVFFFLLLFKKRKSHNFPQHSHHQNLNIAKQIRAPFFFQQESIEA